MVSYRRIPFLAVALLLSIAFSCATLLQAQDVWSGPAFSADSESLRKAAVEIKAAKDTDATILLSEFNVSFDAAGKAVKHRHLIYRIETQEGVEGWSEVRGNWEPWYQARPEIKARVIAPDGVMHSLDPATLNDVPVHENAPDLYSDERAFGGPLPALAPGAIVEEEVVTRDSAVFFSGGSVEQFVLARNVPVQKTRIVLSHPESLPFHYVLHGLAEAAINKTVTNGVETIILDKGRLEPYSNQHTFLPPDVFLYPEIEFSTGTSWQNVSSEYARQLNQKLRVADVQPLVSKLELGTQPGMDTVRRIVAALHKNVRYTGIEFGESSIIPQFPGETLKRKYGDCKDKATLLITMLRAAGISANLALLSSGPGQDTNPDLPGMGTFDHAIVYVPAAGAIPELWIDATAQHSRVGDLPDMDYGRRALIVDEKTTGLKTIPELTSDKNVHIETREFVLADYGPARIVEKDEQFGPTEAEYRDYYGGDAKKVKQSSEDYVKSTYLADSLTSLDKTDPGDLDKPFTVTFIAKGRRGFSELNNSVVYIPVGNIFDGMPKYFLTSEKQAKDESEDSDEDVIQPRTVDWLITPFVTEWHYKITAPAGFKIRALPQDKDEKLGSARFTQKYSVHDDGAVVEASLKFDSGKARLTVNEAKELRDAVLKIRSGDGISITFDQAGSSLISAGKIREALSVDRQLVARHPKDALQRVRLALALLAAGLGEKAKATAKEAIALEPSSARAFSELAWILEHDQIGRRFGKGFDYDGAVAAYRKAKQLDPKDKPIRANLAILLEYGPDGVRYSKKAHLEDAIQEFKDLKKLDEEYAQSYEDYIPYDLWYLGRFKEVIDYVSAMPSSDMRKGLIVAAVAALEGTDAALKKSLEITSREQDRGQALMNAGWLLTRLRKYPQGADLLAAGASGQKDENQVGAYAARLRKNRPREELKIDDSTPTGVILKMFNLMYMDDVNVADIRALESKDVQSSYDPVEEKKGYESVLGLYRAEAERAGVSTDVLFDTVLSNALFSTEGDDALGYKVTVQTPGAQPQEIFVVHEDNRYRIVAFGGASNAQAMGWEALARLKRNDIIGARKWLDWARDKVHINQGDDPLSGQPFPHFWTKGQQGDEAAIRAAALVLLPSADLKDAHLAAVLEARNNAKTDAIRTDLNLVLAHAYAAQQKWTELLGVSEELMKESPDSFIAFSLATRAYAGLKRFDEWEKLLQTRLQAHPDEPDYIRSAASLADYRGQFTKSRQLLKGLIDRGSASANDLNSYAWDALYTGEKIDQDALDAAHRASDLTKNSNFSILHTVACLYAASGKTKEAREYLMKAMEKENLGEPDSAVWLALAAIAEQYGETDAARAMYARVEKEKVEYPTGNFVLAQQRLAALQKESMVKAAGQ